MAKYNSESCESFVDELVAIKFGSPAPNGNKNIIMSMVVTKCFSKENYSE